MADIPAQSRLKDIAAACGVHVATVSAVLNASGRAGTRVSPETAEEIRRTAQRLNYRPNRYAQITRNRRSGTIGMIQMGSTELTTLHSAMLASAVRQAGYELVVNNLMWFEKDVDAAFENLFDARVEGILLSHPRAWISQRSLQKANQLKIPILAFNGAEIPGVPQIRHDAYSGFRQLATHLLQRGRKRIYFIGARHPQEGGPGVESPHLERLRAVQHAIAEFGGQVIEDIDPSTPSCHPSPVSLPFIAPIYSPVDAARSAGPEIAYENVRALIHHGYSPDALLCAHDRHALGALRACVHESVSVPEVIAITGYGNESYGAYLAPSLTTLSFGLESDADLAVSSLIKAVKNEQALPPKVFASLPGELIIRESS